MKLKIKKLDEKAVIPKYAKQGDACMDIVATGMFYDDYGNICYNTGLAFEIEEGYEMELRPRSSISKYCVALANTPATVDAGYRGEVIIKFKPTPHFHNLIGAPLVYEVGDKIVQFKINKVEPVEIEEVFELSDSERGTGGFGSSGK